MQLQRSEAYVQRSKANPDEVMTSALMEATFFSVVGSGAHELRDPVRRRRKSTFAPGPRGAQGAGLQSSQRCSALLSPDKSPRSDAYTERTGPLPDLHSASFGRPRRRGRPGLRVGCSQAGMFGSFGPAPPSPPLLCYAGRLAEDPTQGPCPLYRARNRGVP